MTDPYIPFLVNGRVKDATNDNAVLASVSVILTNRTKGTSITTTTNTGGEYIFDLANLSTGYSVNDVIVVSAGDPYLVTKVRLSADESINQNEGGKTETITWYVSSTSTVDGVPVNWESVSNGVEKTLAYSGNDLKWKAVLYGWACKFKNLVVRCTVS